MTSRAELPRLATCPEIHDWFDEGQMMKPEPGILDWEIRSMLSPLTPPVRPPCRTAFEAAGTTSDDRTRPADSVRRTVSTGTAGLGTSTPERQRPHRCRQPTGTASPRASTASGPTGQSRAPSSRRRLGPSTNGGPAPPGKGHRGGSPPGKGLEFEAEDLARLLDYPPSGWVVGRASSSRTGVARHGHA